MHLQGNEFIKFVNCVSYGKDEVEKIVTTEFNGFKFYLSNYFLLLFLVYTSLDWKSQRNVFSIFWREDSYFNL